MSSKNGMFLVQLKVNLLLLLSVKNRPEGHKKSYVILSNQSMCSVVNYRRSKGSVLPSVPSINFPEYLFCPIASLETKRFYKFKQIGLGSIFFHPSPRQDRSVNTFHVNSQVASLYASIAAVGTLKWLFAGMNKLVVLYFAVFHRLAAKVADYLSEPAQSQYSTRKH